MKHVTTSVLPPDQHRIPARCQQQRLIHKIMGPVLERFGAGRVGPRSPAALLLVW